MSNHVTLITPNAFGGELRQFPGVVTAAGPRTRNGDWLALTLTTSDSSGSVEINYRELRDDGEIMSGTQLMTFSGTGTQTAVIGRLGDGWLQGFSVHRVSGTLTDGEVVAAVHLGKNEGSNATYQCCLASGEITNIRSLGMGAFLALSTTVTTTQPTIATTAAANPAAGSDWSVTVTASQVWEIQSVRGQLVTSGSAGNRTVSIKMTDGTNTLFRIEAVASQAASTTYQYAGAAFGAQYTPPATNSYIIPLPRIMLAAGSVISTVTNGILAGDQWSEIAVQYRQY